MEMESAVSDSPSSSRSTQSGSPSRTPPHLTAWTERIFLAFLVAVFGYLASFASTKLLWFDELLSFHTEHAATTSAVLKIQASTPVSLDPPLYHLLGHWILALGWNQALSIRLPSLLGSLLMVVGIYLYTRRIAGFYAAAISVAGLILTYDFYLVEARPYGILLGATALALLFWQNAIRGIQRTLSLLGLFAVLSLAVSCHYFGILIPLPLLLAELSRTIRRRRLDLPITAALFIPYAAVLFWLPFLKAAGEYKAHYYVSADFMNCIRSYSWLDEIHRNVKGIPAPIDTLLFLLIVASVIAGAWISHRASQSRPSSHVDAYPRFASLPEEWLALVFVSLVPVFGGVLALCGAGSYLARYVLESSIGLLVPRVTALLSFVRSQLVKTAVLALCCILIVAAFLRDRRSDGKERDLMRFSEAQASPGTLVIPDQYDDYLRLHYYAGQDRLTASLFPFVAAPEDELTWKGTDNLSRTMLNMKQFTPLPVIRYEDLLHAQKPVVVIVNKSDRHTWIAQQLQHDHLQLVPRATHGNLTVYDLRLPESKPKP